MHILMGVNRFKLHPQWCGGLLMFCSGSGWTFRDGLYGIANQSIDHGLGLHRPIGILIPFLWQGDTNSCMFSQTVHCGFGGETIFVSPQRCGDVLMFCWGHGWTPRDGLYGIADQSVDPGLDLHGPISIPELSTLDPKVRTIPIVCSIDCFSVTGRSKLLSNSCKFFIRFFEVKWFWLHPKDVAIFHA